MRLLLDTHYLLWLMRDPTKLTNDERAAIAAAEQRYVSALSIWEVRIKWNTLDRHGRRKSDVSPTEALAFLDAGDPKLREIMAGDFMLPLAPRPAHRDPFDEMLLVQAERLGARLLTRDRVLRTHPLAYQP